MNFILKCTSRKKSNKIKEFKLNVAKNICTLHSTTQNYMPFVQFFLLRKIITFFVLKFIRVIPCGIIFKTTRESFPLRISRQFSCIFCVCVCVQASVCVIYHAYFALLHVGFMYCFYVARDKTKIKLIIFVAKVFQNS